MNHEIFMQRCLQLATNALGRTYPNPIVGSVIVYNGRIIGEGFHKRAGEPHAEVMAINSVKDKSLLPKSTLYVNLEPCSHYGKTPPCADLIVKWKIPKVVVGTIDTSAKVAGKGIKRLVSAGIDVTTGILEQQARWINRRFFTYNEKKRPYIILKWAQSQDGFIAPSNQQIGKPYQISSILAHTLVHKWRAQEQAIAVGTNTVLKDNPRLTVRLWYGQNPIRICVDFHDKIPDSSKIFDQSSKTICLKDNSFVNLSKFIDYLYHLQIQSIIIEGGSLFLNSFIKKNLWDEIRLFSANKLILSGLKSPQFHGKILYSTTLKNETFYLIVPQNEKNFSNISGDIISYL